MRRQFSKIVLAAAFGLALAFTFSCSGDGGGGSDHGSIKKDKIEGFAQKGPFAQGTTVKVYELDANYEKTKNSFDGVITDSKGNFEIKIKNGKLASQYVILEVSGKYANEVSGSQTSAPITLNAVADVLNKNSVNINVLTHLEYSKVLKLAKSGTDFEKAKEETQREVFNALGISESGGKNSEDISLFGGSPSDSVLLAVSVLLQGNRSAEEVSSLLSTIGSEIKDNGILSSSVKAEVSDGLANMDMNKVRESILSLDPSAKIPSLEDIKNIVVKIDSATTLPSGGDKGNNIANYRTVKIGNHTWMAENLNYNVAGSRCYNDSIANCDIYGRLYNWATAMVVCPSGWHLPTDAEWATLINFVGDTTAVAKLKANSNLWLIKGTDEYGFSALPGGGYDYGNFLDIGTYGKWWTATELGSDSYAMLRPIYYSNKYVYQDSSLKTSLFSVRCVQNYTLPSSSSIVPSSSSIVPSDSSIVPSSSSIVPSDTSSVRSSSSVFIVVPSSESRGPGQIEGNVFTDPRDGNKYKFEVAPDGKVWMTENLNYSRGNTLGYCYGVDMDGANPHRDSTSCGNGYGRVYEWATATDNRSRAGLCPSGWRIPSTAEWSSILSIGAVARKMSIDFYIYPGHYNINPDWPPLGWVERDKNGFYWTSNASNYFVGFWEGNYCKTDNLCDSKIQDDAAALEYYSVRCIADDLACGTSKYNTVTQFCEDGKVYDRCGGKTYDPEDERCVDGLVTFQLIPTNSR